MKPNTGAKEMTYADIAVLHARAQQMRAEAMAEMIRALGRTIVRGWALLARRSHILAH